MADEEKLEILKQGIEVWNKWWRENIYTSVISKKADFSNANFSEAQLNRVDFRRTNLRAANLSEANLSEAKFGGASLTRANFTKAILNSADLTAAIVEGTIFGNIDLSETIGLEEVFHQGPSTIGIDTLQLSKGKIPDAFLRGCGLSDFEIESARLYNHDLSNQEIDEILYKIHDLRARQSIQVSPLFISYSHEDSMFVNMLEHHLNKKGIRFWRDIHDMKAGRMETQIDHAIRKNPTVLVILSEHSLKSDWVEHEVRTARVLEKEMTRDVLCPIALDDSWKKSSWSKRIIEQIMEYNILDFSEWKDEAKFGYTFDKLIDGLELFYK